MALLTVKDGISWSEVSPTIGALTEGCRLRSGDCLRGLRHSFFGLDVMLLVVGLRLDLQNAGPGVSH